ncbi:MAG TPA: hypothetical protein VK794_15745 [Steroidobacteraceae bacterium]|nr:hypothetical protein [Steroidobacteraceae bacterium]
MAGSFGLVSAYALEADRLMHVMAGLFLILIGVAVFIAKPVTIETIVNIGRRMSRSE